LACDAETKLGRVIRLENAKKKNAISGRNIGYKFMPSATQLLLANPDSVQARRAGFARHHVWVTGYRDGELWAAGEFTNQSRKESGGVSDMVKRRDWFVEGAQLEESRSSGYNEGEEDREGRLSSPVVWSVFGFTHNPRVEDWPVM
jgi:primary-amine oxidase